MSDEFTRFPEFPAEVRQQIWRTETWSYTSFKRDGRRVKGVGHISSMAAGKTCREAREVMKLTHTRIEATWSTRYHQGPMFLAYINFDRHLFIARDLQSDFGLRTIFHPIRKLQGIPGKASLSQTSFALVPSPFCHSLGIEKCDLDGWESMPEELSLALVSKSNNLDHLSEVPGLFFFVVHRSNSGLRLISTSVVGNKVSSSDDRSHVHEYVVCTQCQEMRKAPRKEARQIDGKGTYHPSSDMSNILIGSKVPLSRTDGLSSFPRCQGSTHIARVCKYDPAKWEIAKRLENWGFLKPFSREKIVRDQFPCTHKLWGCSGTERRHLAANNSKLGQVNESTCNYYPAICTTRHFKYQ